MTNLLHNEALKRGVNLSCMREDGRYELQIMSICDGAIFSLLLLMPNLQRTICMFVACSRLTVNSCYCYVYNNLPTETPRIPK